MRFLTLKGMHNNTMDQSVLRIFNIIGICSGLPARGFVK
jgi:hypothetical protein